MGKSLEEWKPGDPMINAGDYWQDPNYVAEDPEKEKLVLKLATLITDRYVKKFTGKINNRDPEYWMLNMILTKEQVKFLLSFKKTRVPYTVAELAEKNGMSLEDTQKMVEDLRWIGIIEQNRAKTPDKHLQYELPIFVP
ncbi:MAG: pyridine nucleotide-disulfide oxidoreductase, partial [Lachnospiraceae bacterium]|nr:pyridine nucleotide-disulfide oxidoreductase [Lachnospiraceae bacterium]